MGNYADADDEEERGVQSSSGHLLRRGNADGSFRAPDCSDPRTNMLSMIFLGVVIGILIAVPVLIIVSVQLASFQSTLDKNTKHWEQTMYCVFNNFCEGTGLNCQLHKSVPQCHFGISGEVSSDITQYFSDISSDSSFSPNSPSPHSSSPSSVF